MTLIEKIRKIVISTALTGALVGCANNQPKPFWKVAVYYDTREKPTATITAGASDLPLGTKFFSFIDAETEKDNPDNLKKPYGEFRLSKKHDKSGLGVAVEHNQDFSQSKGTTRAGLIYEPNLKELLCLENVFLGVKFFPASTNDHGMQVGLYGNATFLEGDITLDGFADYNFKPKKLVADLQVGKRIVDSLYFVIEGRYNGFMEENDLGAGIGLEWRF